MHIGIVHDALPWPAVSGASTRIASLIRFLNRAGAEVTLVVASGRQRRISSPETPFLGQVVAYRAPGFANLLRRFKWSIDDFLMARSWPTLDSLLVRMFKSAMIYKERENWERYPRGLDSFVFRLHSRRKFDALIVEYIWMHEAASILRDYIPVVLDMHDLMHKRAEAFQANGIRYPLRIDKESEFRILDTFDAAIAIQHAEATTLEENLTRCRVLRVGVDTFNPIPMPDAGDARILYIGGANECNVDGLLWFLREVWPEIVGAASSAELVIAGDIGNSIKPLISTSPANTRFLGFVEDPSPLYAWSNICINPINFGSGLKIKTVEALGAGRPLVTSPAGVDGMTPAPTDACSIAAGRDEWIAQLRSLCLDRGKRDRYAKAAQIYAGKWLTDEAVYRDVQQWLGDLAKKASR